MTKSAAATIDIDIHRVIAPISPLLFGGFAEHMGRCVYEGIYDPASPLADADGLRTDVLAALREQRYTVIRYPGGDFLSGHHWVHGVGPKSARPRRRELAWKSIETNQFGTAEFMAFCRKIHTLPMLAVNMGTGTIEEAGAYVEYCNAPTGSYWADLRASHGQREPYAVRHWCVGNEMDGSWQIGHLEAADYGRKALEAAKLMKLQDPSIETILCGSSDDRMKTYPEWDRVALEIAWEKIDYHSIHFYADNAENDTASYLAFPLELDRFVDTVAGTLRYVKAKNRSKHDVSLSWDEWNVWYKNKVVDGAWAEAPHLVEEIYNLEDALLIAQWMSLFLRKADVLKIACIAQIVNIIAPLLTTRTGLLKQSIFYPFALFSNHATGNALDVNVRGAQTPTKRYGDVPALDVSACHDPATGKQAVFIVNRSPGETITASVNWQSGPPEAIREAWQLCGTDPKAANSWEMPGTVTARNIKAPKLMDGATTLKLPPLSFTVLVA